MPAATLIADARAFYCKLTDNNKRDWWLENKATYDEKLKAPALELLDALAPKLMGDTAEPVKVKLFSPYRDVRFSKDKTPYKTDLRMMWQPQAGAPQNPVFFFGIGVDHITVGAGMRMFEKPMLEDWRKFADLDAKRMLGIFDAIETQGYAIHPPALKRVPQGFDKDHIAGHLLRMKGVMVSTQISDDVTVLPAHLLSHFTALQPINDLLLQIAEA
jgi:uncharacterized protein (TIGR02453 family)